MFKNFNKNKYNRGISLIELLVVISIVAILTGVILIDNRKYKSSLSTQNLADDIALSIRKAQSYAVGVYGNESLFDSGYGVHFAVVSKEDSSNPKLSDGTNKSFVLFKDIAYDNMYNKKTGGGFSVNSCGSPSLENECLEILEIKSSDTINSIEVTYNNTMKTYPGAIDITFKRPNLEPTFCITNDNNDGICNNNSSSVESVTINVKNINGTSKKITIWKNGQISVI